MSKRTKKAQEIISVADETKFSFHPLVEESETILHRAKELLVEFKMNQRDTKQPQPLTKEFIDERFEVVSDICIVSTSIQKELLRGTLPNGGWGEFVIKLNNAKQQLQALTSG